VEGHTKYVVKRMRSHCDIFPKGKTLRGGKRLIKEYLVEWKSSTQLDW
jgi:hypothetical protein